MDPHPPLRSERNRTGRLARLADRLESILYAGGWPVRLARALGAQPVVRTVQYVVGVGPTSAGIAPLRIAYASDFHAGPLTDASVLREACAALRRSAPDVLLLGGDFVTGETAEIAWLARELSTVDAPLGRFAVLGNHDRWSGAVSIIEELEAVGIRVLVNANARLPPPYDWVWICGLDDHSSGRPDAAAAVRGAVGTRVVLMHAPSGVLDLGGERFELALCGHTHGGQLALPGGRAVVVPSGALSRRYTRGRFVVHNGATLIVSVGLGCVVLPLRTFADPEVVLCTVEFKGKRHRERT
jgi:predicted MPP superfamily phosphohydrolase